MMNGTINVESKLGKGSIFTVTLPLPSERHFEFINKQDLSEQSHNYLENQARQQLQKYQIPNLRGKHIACISFNLKEARLLERTITATNANCII